MRLNRKYSLFILLFALIFIAGSSVFYYVENERESKGNIISKSVVDAFLTAVEEEKSSLNKVLLSFQKEKNSFSDKYYNSPTNSYYCFKDSSLISWTSNKQDVSSLLDLATGIFNIDNSWYVVKRVDRDSLHLFGLSIIEKKFQTENSILKEYSNPKFLQNKNWKLSSKSSKRNACKQVFEFASTAVFLCKRDSEIPQVSSFGILFDSIGVLLLAIFLLFYSFKRKNHLAVKLGAIILSRILLMHPLLIPVLKQTLLFQPELYADSSVIPSFGDLIIHVLCFFLIALCITLHSKNDPRTEEKKLKSGAYGFLVFGMMVVVWYSSFILPYTMDSLLGNSQINLNLANFFVINWHTVIAVLVLGILYVTLCRFIKVVVANAYSHLKPFVVLALIVGVFISSLFVGMSLNFSLFAISWSLPLWFFAIYKKDDQTGSFSLAKYFPEILIFCCLLSFYVEKEERNNSDLKVEQHIETQSQERDAIAEFLLVKTIEELEQDHLPVNSTTAHLASYIRTTYYNKYLNQFDLKIAIDSIPKSEENLIGTGDYSEYSKISEGLFLKLAEGSMSYKIELEKQNKKVSLFYTAKKIPIGEGFPMILANKSMEKVALGRDYSYAKYRNSKLIEREGTFNYLLNSESLYLPDSVLQKKIRFKGYVHVLHRKHGNIYVISKKVLDAVPFTSKLSFSLIFIGSLLFLYLMIERLLTHKQLVPPDFKGRLQYSLLFMLFLSSVVLAVVSTYYLRKQYNVENFEAISEKIKSVQSSLSKQGEAIELKTKLPVMENSLQDLSETFFTDINLFNSTGSLLSTTQETIFNEGILSRQMDPKAFNEIYTKGNEHFVQVEHIESLSYLSAYIPIVNYQGEKVACLNLPYFAKSDVLRSDINEFLSALINMYLLLTVVFIVLALIISNRMTKPLILIKDKISNLSLAGKNETIEWESNDEIGGLVTEYNRMVTELSKNTTLLLEAEREGAWKEMAQQVAHEIKNPLTPMKLNVQHLQFRWPSLSEEDKNTAVGDLTKVLVEQIDTLSSIATQFSSFARIEDGIIENTSIYPIIESSVNLHEGNLDVAIQIIKNSAVPQLEVLACKENLVRIFNNVIKNAIQSFTNGQKGKVSIEFTETDEYLMVHILDDGCGIPSDKIHSIFEPKFTTKKSGMGLGLSMVRQMLEKAEGGIECNSEEGKGTEFVLSFKKVK